VGDLGSIEGGPSLLAVRAHDPVACKPAAAVRWCRAAQVLRDRVAQRDGVPWSQGDGLLGLDGEEKEGARCATERQPWLQRASSSIAKGREG